MKKRTFILIGCLVAALLVGTLIGRLTLKDVRRVDKAMTVEAIGPIHLIDDRGQDVGLIDFSDEITVTIKRKH